jgi:hypothetical protein
MYHPCWPWSSQDLAADGAPFEKRKSIWCLCFLSPTSESLLGSVLTGHQEHRHVTDPTEGTAGRTTPSIRSPNPYALRHRRSGITVLPDELCAQHPPTRTHTGREEDVPPVTAVNAISRLVVV